MPLGKDGVLKYDIGGQAGGSWTEMENCKDVTSNLETSQADVTVRGSGDWSESVPVHNDGTIEFDMIVDSGDADYAAFRTAFFDRSVIGIQFYDEDGGEGTQGDYQIVNFTHNQPLEEYQTVSVQLKPTRNSLITQIP